MATSTTPAIAHEDLVQAHQDGTCAVVDVRAPHEYAGGHIPGAVNHPLSQFDRPRAARRARRADLSGVRTIRDRHEANDRSREAGRAALCAGMSGWRARKGPEER